jgi:hypothetical protein
MNTEVVGKYPLEFHDVVKSKDFTAVTSLFQCGNKTELTWEEIPSCMLRPTSRRRKGHLDPRLLRMANSSPVRQCFHGLLKRHF